MASQLGDQTRHPVALIMRPAVFDRDVLAIDVTGLLETLEERRVEGRQTLRRLAVEESDHRHRRLLRPRRKRPTYCRAAEQRYELAAVAHSITSSTVAHDPVGWVPCTQISIERIVGI